MVLGYNKFLSCKQVFQKMRKQHSFIPILILFRAMLYVECTSTKMKLLYSEDVIMDEEMFKKFYECMEDPYSQKCILSLRMDFWNDPYIVNYVYKIDSYDIQESDFTCQFSTQNYEQVVCQRSDNWCNSYDSCLSMSFNLDFTIYWKHYTEGTNDTSHKVCDDSLVCSFYGKSTSTSTLITPSTTFTSTSRTSKTTTSIDFDSEATSTLINTFKTSYFSHSPTETQALVNETQNATLHSDLHQNVNVDNIIIGSVVSAVLLVIAGFVILFLWKKRLLRKDNSLNNATKSKLNKLNHINSDNVSTLSNPNAMSNKAYDSTNDKFSDNYDQYNVANRFQGNYNEVICDGSSLCTTTEEIRPTGLGDACYSNNGKRLDKYDQYNLAKRFQDNYSNVISNGCLPCTTSEEIRQSGLDNNCNFTNDNVSGNHDEYTVANNSQDNNCDKVSRDNLPYSNAKELELTCSSNPSDKVNTVYQNISEVSTKSESKDYARLGQEVKVFKHDYNCLIPDEEDKKLTHDPVDNVSVENSSNISVY